MRKVTCTFSAINGPLSGLERRTKQMEVASVVSGEPPALRRLTFCFPLVVIFAGRLIRLSHVGAAQVALVVENPPAMQEPQETWV